MAFDCMNDCIHLHACRRIQAIGKKHRLLVPRYCTEDCDCYCSGKTLVCSAKEAIEYARIGASSILSGYDTYDVYCTSDIGIELQEFIDKIEEYTD